MALLATTACTQSPARIDMKGQQNYGRGDVNYNSNRSSSSSSYSSRSNSNSNSSGYTSIPSTYSAPVSQTTEDKAPVSSIGISDLAPPPAASAAHAPAATSSTSAVKQDNAVTDNADSTVNDGDFVEPVKTDKKKTGGMRPVVKTTVNPWTNKPRSSNDEMSVPEKMPFKLASKQEVKEIKEAKEVKEEKKITLNSSRTSSELKWPTASKRILSSFGAKGAGKANDGVNIAAENGSPVWAAADGQVVYVKNGMRGYGNLVLIKHSGDRYTSYAHLERIAVNKYDKVGQGEVVGYVGTTGNVKTPQLFFSLHKGKEPVDPQKYLSNQFAGL